MAQLVFDFNGSFWEQRGSPSVGAKTLDQIGAAVSLSADGNVVAIGALAAHASVHEWTGGTWTARGSVTAATTSTGQQKDLRTVTAALR